VGYYIHEIAAPTGDQTEALWSVALLTYVHFYHFIGVTTLFEMLRHDISPGGSIFRGFIDKVDQRDLALAKKLLEAAQQEWESLRHGAQSRSKPRIWSTLSRSGRTRLVAGSNTDATIL